MVQNNCIVHPYCKRCLLLKDATLTFYVVEIVSIVCLFVACFTQLSFLQVLHSFLRPIKSFCLGMACVECGKLHSEKLKSKASFRREHRLSA